MDQFMILALFTVLYLDIDPPKPFKILRLDRRANSHANCVVLRNSGAA